MKEKTRAIFIPESMHKMLKEKAEDIGCTMWKVIEKTIQENIKLEEELKAKK